MVLACTGDTLPTMKKRIADSDHNPPKPVIAKTASKAARISALRADMRNMSAVLRVSSMRRLSWAAPTRAMELTPKTRLNSVGVRP